jgi:adenylyltransferase/sulfurtransferase
LVLRTNSISQKQALRYSRQINLPGFDLEKQELLLDSHALVIGVGGLGCSAAQFLAGSGIGQLTLVDFDGVDAHNLPRQILYTQSDVGQNKALVAAKRLSEQYPDTKVQAIETKLDDESLLELMPFIDVVIDCSDNIQTRNQLNALCYLAQRPLVSGAAIRAEGQVFCVLPSQHSACYSCLSQFIKSEELSCAEAGVLSPIVGVIGSMQALQAIKIMTGYGKIDVNVVHLFSGFDMQWTNFNINKDESCLVCNAKDDLLE